MAVAFLDANPFPRYSGGMENWLFHLIQELDRRNTEVMVFVPRSDGAVFYDLREYKKLRLVETWSTGSPGKLYALLKRLIRPLSFLVLALNYFPWIAGAWWALSKHLTKRDRLVVLHSVPGMLPVVLYRCLGGKARITCSVRGKLGADLEELHKPALAWIYKRLERMVLYFADHVISNGQDTATYLRNELGVEAPVLPNGVDFARFAGCDFPLSGEENPHLAQLMELRSRKVILIMTVGTLRDVKGIRFLIEATGHLKKELGREFRTVFVGKGQTAPYLEYAEALGVTDRVLFVGEQKNVARFLRVADVAVAISGGGGVSNALLEMMAAGKAIVAWDNPTYSQVLTHGVSGHLVKDRDSTALGRGILCLVGDSEYSELLAKRAQEIARGYDWPIIADRFLEVIG